MEYLPLIIVLLVLLYLFLLWRQKNSSKKEQPQVTESPRKQELRLENVKQGGVVSLSGVGEKLENLDLVITRVNGYRQGGFTWSELEAEYGGEKVFIEIEDDDDLEFSLTMQSLDLKEIGLTRSDLNQITEEEEGTVTYNGASYYFEEMGEAAFLKDNKEENAEEFRYWEFMTEDEGRTLTVEEWSDGSWNVSLSENIEPHQVTVYSLQEG